MAADTAAPDRPLPSPNTLALNLSSNNPFRNRLSMQASSPRSMDQTMSQFPFPNAATNPFLDPSDSSKPPPPPAGHPIAPNTAAVEDIFRDMTVQDTEKPAFSNGPLPRKNSPPRAGAPLPAPRMPPPDARRDRPPPSRGPPRGPDSPQKRPTEHRRRASESSVMEYERRDRGERRGERGDRPPRTESEERRRRERRREREERYRREKESGVPSSRSRKGQRNLDIIDKLDVTGVFGQGLFHHDGPFDACNPSRNAKKDQRAPMQAFPEGSMNMAIGGSGPNRSRLDLDKFHGRTEEGFNDFGYTRKAPTAYREPERPARTEQGMHTFNPHDRVDQVHGVETHGLGTSTFLEGAPASKSALQRRESEDQAVTFVDGVGGVPGNGLQRKKSLAQRLRGMSASRPRPNPGYSADAGRSPEARYNGGPVELTDEPATSQPRIPAATSSKSGVTTTAAPTVYNKENEVNVFDTEYDKAFDRKGAEIRFAEQQHERTISGNSNGNVNGAGGLKRVPSSPRSNGLTRSVTADSAMPEQRASEDKPSGFLNRMKSLKGGSRRVRPERKDSNS